MKTHQLHSFALTLCALLFVSSCSRDQSDATKKEATENRPPAQAVPASPQQQPAVVAVMPGREPLVENPNFKPSPAPGSSKIDAVAQRIQQQMEGLVPGSPEAQAKFASLWRSSAPATFAQSVASASKAEVAEGRWLPAEASIALMRDEALLEAIESGKLPHLNGGEAELDGVLAKLVLALGSTTSGVARLPSILNERANELPPTVEDVATLVAVKQALRELRSTGAAALPLDEWRSLASAKNPIYRYLALLAAPHAKRFSADAPPGGDSSVRSAQASEDLLRFYQPYLSETDGILVEQAIKAVGNLGTARAIQTLEGLASKPQVVTDKRLTEAVQIAIQNCDAMIRLADGK